MDSEARSNTKSATDDSASPNREHVRYRTGAGILVKELPDGAFRPCVAYDISRGGFFIQSKAPPQRGSGVEIRATLADGTTMSLEAVVAHVVLKERSELLGVTMGFGVALMNQTPESKEFMRAFVEVEMDSTAEAKGKILVVDDSPTVLGVARVTLENAGYEVVTISEALRVSMTVLSEKPDLVLMDVNMPLLDGNKLIEIMRRSLILRDCKVLLHSSEPASVLRDLTQECAADGFIRKTTDRERLVEQVDTWMERRKKK